MPCCDVTLTGSSKKKAAATFVAVEGEASFHRDSVHRLPHEVREGQGPELGHKVLEER